MHNFGVFLRETAIVDFNYGVKTGTGKGVAVIFLKPARYVISMAELLLY